MVTHGDILQCLLMAFSSRVPQELKPLFNRAFRNAEMRSFILSDMLAEPLNGHHAFCGGNDCMRLFKE